MDLLSKLYLCAHMRLFHPSTTIQWCGYATCMETSMDLWVFVPLEVFTVGCPPVMISYYVQCNVAQLQFYRNLVYYQPM